MNKQFWDALKTPPPWALKAIQAGRLKGKSDINPQWRILAMTEVFGPVGMGWKYTIDKLWSEPGNGEQMMAFALVSVYVWQKERDRWSDPIPGIGGSMLIEQESKGLHTSDEGYKMAVTDALSVAFKALGVAADIYCGEEYTKYNKRPLAQEGRPKTTISSDQEKYFPRIKAALDTLHGTDVAAKKLVCKNLTTFAGEDGKEVEGVEDYRKLDGKRIQVLCHKLEAIVKKGEGNAE